MGTPSYVHLVRQHVGAIGAIGAADSTDANVEHETAVDVSVSGDVRYGQSTQQMFDALKREQTLCLQNGEIRDASMIQNLMLAVLQSARDGLIGDTAMMLCNRTSPLFTVIAAAARQQNRWNSADRFQAVAATYQGPRMKTTSKQISCLVM